MKLNTFFVAIIALALFSSCTENQRAKAFGGTIEVQVPKGNKLVNATWKSSGKNDDANLWMLYAPMDSLDQPKNSVFQEKSSFGVIEGKVIFHESK